MLSPALVMGRLLSLCKALAAPEDLERRASCCFNLSLDCPWLSAIHSCSLEPFNCELLQLLNVTLTRLCMQLVLGEIIVVLFVFVRPIHFRQACLAQTLYLVCHLIVAQDNNLGTKYIAAASLLGSAVLGCVLGGAVVSLAHAPGYMPS